MTKAIILAAGQGSRLRPLTDEIPKTMVKVKGRPIIEYQLESFGRNDISEIHVVAGYREDKLKAKGYHKTLNSDFAKTNMVASLYVLKELFDGTSDIIISYGDIIFDDEVLGRLIENHGDQISTIYDLNWLNLWSHRMDDPLSDAETFTLNDCGNVTGLGEKPKSQADIEGQYIGLIYVDQAFAPKFFNVYESLNDCDRLFDGKDFYNMYMTSYLRLLIEQGTVLKGIAIEGGWVEVDSVADLKVYETLIGNGHIGSLCERLSL